MSNSHQPYSFVVSKEDWSLHRKGYQDQQRHQQKVKDVIKQNLPDLITEENIIMSDGKQIIKVPIRSLDEYRFVYNYQKQKHVGQGDGDSQVGDVIGRDPSASQKPGKGEKAGDQPGHDIVEAEVSIEELEDMLFAELELPDLKQKDKDLIETHTVVFNDIRKKACSPILTRNVPFWRICVAMQRPVRQASITSVRMTCATRHGKIKSFHNPMPLSLP